MRSLYAEAADQMAKAEQLYKFLEKIDKQGNALALAYWGGALALKAKNIFNPFSKLFYINQAQEMFRQAVSLSPENLEIRFIRMSIQINTPAILGLSNDWPEDKRILIQHIEASELIPDLKRAVIIFLIDSKKCSPEEVIYLKSLIKS